MPRTQEHVLTHTPRIPIMYIPAGGTRIRDSRTVELLRDKCVPGEPPVMF